MDRDKTSRVSRLVSGRPRTGVNNAVKTHVLVQPHGELAGTAQGSGPRRLHFVGGSPSQTQTSAFWGPPYATGRKRVTSGY